MIINKVRIVLGIASLLVLLLNYSSLHGQNSAVIHSGQQNLVQILYKKEHYFQASVEMRRLMHMEGAINRDMGSYFIQSCYFLGRQFKSLEDSMLKKDSNRLTLDERILLSQSYLLQNRPQASYSTLKNISYASLNMLQQESLFFRRIEPLLLVGDFNLIEREHYRTPDAFKKSEKMKGFLIEIEKYQAFGKYSPLKAAILSGIIPGSGQLYCKRYADAIISFIAVIGSAAGSYYLYTAGSQGAGLTLGFFSGLFYGGNMYGAWNSARYQNREWLKKVRSDLEYKYIPEYTPIQEEFWHRAYK